MNQRLYVEDVLRATMKLYCSLLGKEKVANRDFSWLTQHFLDEVAATVQTKDADRAIAEQQHQQSEAKVAYCFWGHHHFVTGSGGAYIHYWKNDNANAGCDREDQKCWGDKNWQSDRVGSQTEGGGCPRNSQGFDTGWWAGEVL